MELKRSNVVFNEEEHTYHLGDLRLDGITGRLGKSIFFHDKYKGIPAHILKNKAAFGSMVHKQIELLDTGMPYIPMKEVSSYIKIKEKYGIKVLSSEFLISDNEKYATMIDMIDENLDLYDHKTTVKLDAEYLSWQLSICAFLFEKQTGVKPRDYYVTHFSKDGACKRVAVKKRTDEEVYDMLYTDKYMQEAQMPKLENDVSTDIAMYGIDGSDIETIENIEKEIIMYELAAKKAKQERDELLVGIREKFELYGVSKLELDRLTITKVDDYVRNGVDTNKLFEEHPELEGKYIKTTNVKGGIKIKIK